MANLMAVLVQYLTSKAGLATGRSLPELCRDRFGPRANVLLWLQAEVVAMATDLAEFVGAAVGLNLVFGIPLFPAGLITAVVAFVILGLEQRGLPALRAGDHRPAGAGRRWASCTCSSPSGGQDYGQIAEGLVPRLGGAEHPQPDRRDHRGDRHAARGLPALGAANEPGARGRAPADAARCWPTTSGTASSAWASPGWSTCPCCASPQRCSTSQG